MSMLYLDLQNEVLRRAVKDQGGTQFTAAIKNIINFSLFRTAREGLWRQLRRKAYFTTKTSYTTGTGAAAFTNGSKNFTITGATLLTDGIQVGRFITCSTSSKTYIIRTITGETTGTIDVNYDGTTTTTGSYQILPQEEYNVPIQAHHRMFMWHNEYGYPFQMEYVTDQDFRSRGIQGDTTGVPVVYRMWGDDMIISQPLQASVVSIASSVAGDTSIACTVFGTVSGYPDYEIITTNASNGTTASSGNKLFSSVERIVKSAPSIGRITVTSNSGSATLAVLPIGDTTSGIDYSKVQLWPLPDTAFDINVQYYKEPYRLVNDGDIHELGQEFDEAIILLSVSKLKFENNQKEGEKFFGLWQDEIRSLKKVNVDKIDFVRSLRRPWDSRNRDFLNKNLTYSQIGPMFGPVSRR